MIKPVPNPCEPHCPRRSSTCHGTCKEYEKYVNFRHQISEARRLDHDTTAALIRGAEKIKREAIRHAKSKGL